MPHAGGAPTKYKEEYCADMIKFFDIEPTRTIKETFYYKNGDSKVKEIEVANELPLIQDFCFKIGIHTSTFYKWIVKYKELNSAYKISRDLQRAVWIKNALKGLYNAPFAIFTGKNMFGWRDQQHIDTTIHGELSITDILSKPKG